MLLVAQWLRSNVTDISCTDASTEAPCKAARRRQMPCRRMLRLCNPNLPDTAGTISAASSPKSTPLLAVKFVDAPCYQSLNVCATTLRTSHVRTRRCRSASQGRPAKIVPAGSDRLEVQRRRMPRHGLCRRQAALQGASVATPPYMICP